LQQNREHNETRLRRAPRLKAAAAPDVWHDGTKASLFTAEGSLGGVMKQYNRIQQRETAMAPSYKYDAFISFSSHDTDWAKRLNDDLKDRNIRTFFAPDLRVGVTWHPELIDALRDSQHLVIYLVRCHRFVECTSGDYLVPDPRALQNA
jgi:hypothetical protein